MGQLATSKSIGLRDKDVVQKLKTYRQRFTEAGKDIEELRTAQATLAQDPSVFRNYRGPGYRGYPLGLRACLVLK